MKKEKWSRYAKDYTPATVGEKVYDRVLVYDPKGYPEYSAVPHLNNVVEFAQVVGKMEQFRTRVLDYFQHYSEDKNIRVLLTKDWAPYSFGFGLGEVDEEADTFDIWFRGGVIYHGPHDGYGDGGAPTYLVSLSPTDGWSIHT